MPADHLNIILKSVYGQFLAIDPITGVYYTKEDRNSSWKEQKSKSKAYEYYSFLCRRAHAQRKEKTKFIKKPNLINLI